MRFGKLSYGMELLPYRYRLPGNFRRANILALHGAHNRTYTSAVLKFDFSRPLAVIPTFATKRERLRQLARTSFSMRGRESMYGMRPPSK